ncbi:MAG TPA: maleylpyruvate isomerase family mycothiol-dependent enzyme [Streptosporangiaceae bacterium]
MARAITPGQWEAARAALRDSGERFTELISSCHPEAAATRHWSIADTVAHVTSIALWDASAAQPGHAPPPYPWNAVADQVLTTTVDTVKVLNEQVMERFTERDLQVLAKQLRTHIDDMLRTSAGLDPDRPVRWLGDSRAPLAGIFAHLTNELQIHGRDIARATGSRWVIPPAYAAQFLDVFVAGLTRQGLGRFLDRDGAAPGRRIAVKLVSRHMSPLILVLSPDGAVTLADRDIPVDVRVRLDPATFNLMMFGRVSRVRAALAGKVVVSGPRPWLLPAFLRIVRFPS